jgi:hypothetical protein
MRRTVRVEAARPVDAENALTGLCKTADGFAQLPQRLIVMCLSEEDRRPKPSESLVTDPQILRRRPVLCDSAGNTHRFGKR